MDSVAIIVKRDDGVPRGYPPEFRRRVVELVESGRKVAEVAADLGISEQTIYTWRWQVRFDAGLVDPESLNQNERIRFGTHAGNSF